MNKKDFRASLVALAAACASGGAWAQEQPANDAAASENALQASDATDDIVVTARRRAERLQDVPQAIIALSTEQIERANVTEIADLVRVAPGLVFQPSALSSKSVSLTLRSQRQNLGNITFDPSVVVYFDEVPNMRMLGGNAALYDLASVQVLKGPQGTLFGRNSTGGALLITPQAPTEEFTGYLKVGAGNYDLREIEGAINIPVNDAIQIRLSGRHSERDGYMPVVGKGYSVDDDNTDAFRFSVKLTPTSGVTNTTVLDALHQTGAGTAYRLATCDPAGISNQVAGMCAELDKLDGQKWNATTSNVDRNGIDIKAYQISNITTAEIGGVTLKNIFGYRHLNAFVTFDIDGTAKDVLYATNKIKMNQVSNEIQLLGTAFDNTLSYQFGGFFFEEEGHELQFTPTLGSTSASDLDAINRSYSLFGQMTYKIPGIDGFSVTAGLRYTWDRRQMTNRGKNILGVYTGRDFSGVGDLTVTCRLQAGALPAAGVLNPCEKTVDASFSKMTYNFSVDYKINNNLLTYLATRKGYRAGGFFNAPRAPVEFLPYQPELLTDYELGLKADYRIGGAKARTNIALYTGDFKGAQRSTSTQELVVDPATGSDIFVTRSVILNVQSARVRGIEIEQMFRPFELLELNVSYAFSDAKYKKFIVTNPDGTVLDFTASPFAGAPRHTLSGNARLQIPVDESLGRFFVQLSGSYVSSSVAADGTPSFNPTNVTDTDGTPPQSVRKNAIIDGYTTFDARLDWERVGGTQLDLGIWVRNLTDKHYFPGGQYVQALGFSVKNPGTPRTFGLQARYAF
ncbi:iron complex outermembrane receptor protein [Sphingobium wenxiniae]|uniref:Iron complex outermembrane receptor protein n=1 Tax=Sphingobium wenxiniae (strain DSM 21828 / CGMCC 1.7748 / JZ-1) TaxID=595605 RepID=A0A562K7R5_SPHWJ|nr:TonB-dependent receptor [Sphingobium wenxiniae]MBB6192680.1 iron complex outermembrane receptor protein [Sphingobium wenxiniae]TWH91479.1 iron complex outermembrane receptor protein [Sphingobium wenxiniae]